MPYNPNTPCCIYNGVFSPRCKIYPKNGEWTITNLYEIMSDCELDNDLKGVKPLQISEGGFEWKGTEESIDLWYDTTVSRDYPRSHCDMTRQIRTYNVDSHCYSQSHRNNWKDELLQHEDIDKPMSISDHLYCNTLEMPYIELKCKGNPSFGMFVKLVLLFQKHGHTILRSEGFEIDFNNSKVKRCKGKKYVMVKDMKHQLKLDAIKK